MKDTLGKVSDLTRVTLHDLKKILSLLKLTALQSAITESLTTGNKTKDLEINVPMFGTIEISEDLDFSFIPDPEFKKDIYQVQQNPELFLKRELKKILRLLDKKGD